MILSYETKVAEECRFFARFQNNFPYQVNCISMPVLYVPNWFLLLQYFVHYFIGVDRIHLQMLLCILKSGFFLTFSM